MFESVFMFALLLEILDDTLAFIHSWLYIKRYFAIVTNIRIKQLRSPGKLNYEHPIFFIPISGHYFTYDNNHSIPNSRSHPSDFSVFSVTISLSKRITDSHQKCFETKSHFRTPVHITGVRNDLVRNVPHSKHRTALFARATTFFQYLDPNTLIYMSNLKYFFTKMISANSSTKSTRWRNFLRTCYYLWLTN
jgi:hypothetical protein